MIVADNETAVDLLYYESIALTVVRLIEEKSDEPLTVGIHGDWGAGKSSVLMMLEEKFSDEEKVLCVRFNGWLFQGYEDTKAVLIETIVQELLDRRATTDKVKDQAMKVLRRVDWMKAVRQTGGLAFTIATGIPDPATISSLGEAASALLNKPEEDINADDLKDVVSKAGGLLKETEAESAPQQIHAFRDEFEELLKRADIDRLVVMVDDLDRCLPITAIETLEAIRLFLFVPNAAFVIAADEGMIEYAVRQHFPDLPVTSSSTSYARNYLEKLIQVPFRLPSLGYSETRIYITLLFVLIECGEESDEFKALAKLAKEALRRPWEGLGIERSKVAEALGSTPTAVANALDLANRIAPILTEGTRGNPRQVKRFINTMALRQAIAAERGFDQEIDLSVLAKIMLAEQFAPTIYNEISRSAAADGTPKILGPLEAHVRTTETPENQDRTVSVKKDPPVKVGKKKGEETKSAPVASVVWENWSNKEWAKQWAKIEPQIANKDLRPYLFVTRDQRKGFSPAATLGQLDDLLTRLSGPSIQVRQAASEVANLTTAEAEQLFDAMSQKITSADSLKEKPTVTEGLGTICQHHKFLQSSFVALLKGLPVTKLGPWVVTGAVRYLTEEPAVSEFKELMNEWQIQTENKVLQTAAKSAVTLTTKSGRS